jgi:hypothetical protein
MIDTNRAGGLSNPDACDRIRTNGDSLILGGCPDGDLPLPKMENDPAGIVGAWVELSGTTPPVPLFRPHLFFFSNGTFLRIDPASGGIESGAYSYDGNILSIRRLDYDTDGNAGFGNGNKQTLGGVFAFALRDSGKTGILTAGYLMTAFARISR